MSTTTDTRQSLPLGTWALDPVHSTIGFEVNYLAGTFRGQFRDVAAQLEAGKTPVLTGSAKVASVDVKDENLAAHLQTPDFFDTERHARHLCGKQLSAYFIESHFNDYG